MYFDFFTFLIIAINLYSRERRKAVKGVIILVEFFCYLQNSE